MNNNKRITIEVPEDMFYKIKVYCAEQKISIKDFLTNIIKEKLN